MSLPHAASGMQAFLLREEIFVNQPAEMANEPLSTGRDNKKSGGYVKNTKKPVPEIN